MVIGTVVTKAGVVWVAIERRHNPKKVLVAEGRTLIEAAVNLAAIIFPEVEQNEQSISH